MRKLKKSRSLCQLAMKDHANKRETFLYKLSMKPGKSALCVCVCVCVRACARLCVRALVRACVGVSVHARACGRIHACMYARSIFQNALEF